MKIRHVGTLRRAGLAAGLAAALTVSLTACSGGDGPQPPAKVAAESPSDKKDEGQGKSTSPGQSGGLTLPDNSEVIATLKSSAPGIEMVLYSVIRDDGGFLTVNGEIKNNSGQRYTIPLEWNGQEKAVAATGRSFAAMTLIDSKEKQLYYVLRADNRPLTTTGFTAWLKGGESLPFFAQFPAPPATTTKVDLQFPGFPNASLEIS